MADTTGEPLRLVILGKTGVGKSHVGNILVGRNTFVSKASANSVTKECKKEAVTGRGRQIEVIDTPGVMDTSRKPEEVAKEILRCIEESSPGPHAFLLIIQATRFTKEEQNAVKALQQIFGERVADYMIVIFNRADELGNQSIDKYVKECTKELREVLKQCGGRYLPFYNKNREQVAKLVRMVDQLIVLNGVEHFSNEVYEDLVREPESFMGRWLNKMIQWVRKMNELLRG